MKKQFNIYAFLLCIITWHYCIKTAQQEISREMLKSAIERKIEQSKKIYDPINNEVLVYNNTIDYEMMRQNIREKIAAIKVPVMFFSREGQNSYKMESYTPEQGFITLTFLEPDARHGKLTLFSLDFSGFKAKSAIFLASHAHNNTTDKYVMRHIIDTFPTIGIQKEEPYTSLLPAIQEAEKRGPVTSYYYSNPSQPTKVKPFIRLDPATIGTIGLFIVMPTAFLFFIYKLLKL